MDYRAMLKDGRVVALDSTEALIHQASEPQLVLQVEGNLPDSLQPLVLRSKVSGNTGNWVLRINQYTDIRHILSELEKQAVTVNSLQVQEPDLEEVFLQIMDSRKH